MSDNNSIEYTVRIKSDGLENLEKLKTGLDKATGEATGLGDSAGTAAQDLADLGKSADVAGGAVEDLANAQDLATQDAQELSTGADTAARAVTKTADAAAQAESGLEQLAAAENQTAQAAHTLDTGAAAAADSVVKAGSAATKATSDVNRLSEAEDKAAGQAQELGQSAISAKQGITEIGKSSEVAGAELGEMAEAMDEKTRSIKNAINVERSEIEVQRQTLEMHRGQQQALLQTAKARGDAIQATQAQSRLYQIEADQLALTARARRAEADAIQKVVDAKRQQLSAIGPLTQAQQQELQVAENQAKALRVQAAAAGEAAQQQRAYASTANQGAQATDKLGQSSEAASFQLNKIAGAIAAAFSVNALKGVLETADEFKNLEARVKLATGAGENFATGMQGVIDVSKRTHTALEGTATLFARITKVGTEAGLSAVKAQEQALQMTETINQTIQLSGGSAQSAEAAITQLIQGLQSGVVRGEEFNSIMEQSPRLASAMAAGLGVNTGELRKMSEQGLLTSQTVIRALQSQSAVVQKEFDQLPATIGRSIQDLHTNWMVFVGGLNESTNATTYVAQGINVLAGNLDSIARMATIAGAALTAALAVQGVAALRAYAAEAALAAGATNLLSASARQVPGALNITVAAVGFEVGYQIGEMLYENSSLARQLGVGLVGFFELTLNSLNLLKESAEAIFTSDTVDAAFERYKQRNVELYGHMRDMMKDAEQAPQKVGDAASAAAGHTAALGASVQTAGGQVAQAGAVGAAGIGQIAKAADNAAGAFRALLAEAAKPPEKNGTAAQIAQELDNAKKRGVDLDALLRTTLPEAISKLSGAELAKFRQDFTEAMQLSDDKGRVLQTGLRLIGEQAAQSLGVDTVAASSKMGDAFVQANENMRMLILSLPELKAAGIDTGQVVAEALSKMIDSAKNQAELDALRQRLGALRKELGDPVTDGLLEQARQKTVALQDAIDKAKPGVNSLREALSELGMKSADDIKQVESRMNAVIQTLKDAAAQGLITGEQLAEGLGKARQKIDEAKIGINSIAEAMKALGMATAQELDEIASKSKSAWEIVKTDGTASANVVRQAFEVMAKAAMDAAERQGDVAVQATRRTLEAEAAVKGLSIQFDATGKVIVSSMNAGSGAVSGVTKALSQTTEQLKAQAEAWDGLLMKYKLSRDYTESQIALLEKQNALIERQAELERKRLNIDKEGFSLNTAGQRVVQEVQTKRSVYEKAKAAGLDDKMALELADKFINDYGEQKGASGANYAAGENWYTEVQKAIDKAVLDGARKLANGDGNSKSPAPGPGSPTSPSVITHNVNIRWNTTPVGVIPTNATGVGTVNELLRQLETASGRS